MATPLRAKLQLKYGQTLEVLDAPADVLPEVADLSGPDTAGVLAFVTSRDDVAKHAAALSRAAAEADGLAWAAYPKKSSGVTTDITRDHGWDALHAEGLQPVRQVAIDDTWSALRFRRPEHSESESPPAPRGADRCRV
jgi:hypothetical protein